MRETHDIPNLSHQEARFLIMPLKMSVTSKLRLFFAIFLAFFIHVLPLKAFAQPVSDGALIVADDLRIVAESATKTRLIVSMSGNVEVKTFVIERPDRVVIELPEVGFHVGEDKGRRKQGLVSAVRYGLFAPGRSRMVIELAQPATVARIASEARQDGRADLVIELVRVERETFHKAALADALANATRPVASATHLTSSTDTRPLIMIDPGHGGIDPGAKAGETLEKDIVFSFAKTLKEHLDKQGKYRVHLTRDQDVFVSLGERVNMARAAKADLFISIHADTISSSQVRGLTVYTGSERATDAESARLAEKENEADAVGGIEVSQAPEGIADILQELTLRETRNFSNRLALTVVSNLNKIMPLNKNPHREAGFRVLRAPDVPSVLVELGYMSSRQDIDLLLSQEWRDQSAEALAKALDQYFIAKPGN